MIPSRIDILCSRAGAHSVQEGLMELGLFHLEMRRKKGHHLQSSTTERGYRDVRARPSSKEGSERVWKSSEVIARAGYKEILKNNQPTKHRKNIKHCNGCLKRLWDLCGWKHSVLGWTSLLPSDCSLKLALL